MHSILLAAFALGIAATPQEPETKDYRPKVMAASEEGQNAMLSFKLAPGLKVDLIAAEPQLANPVAISIDERGRIYVVETFRLAAGVFDTREYEFWRDEDLACETVEDRLALMRKHLGEDLPKYDAAAERIRLLEDTTGDGLIDKSQVYADRFHELADGIGAGVLAYRGDVWFTCIPQLWRLRDRDGDGRADLQEPLYDGFGVHFSLIGHDMHGLRIGPDRRLYFSIGDRGFNVDAGGKQLISPHSGAVLRCELDGSKLEIYASGLRNPQELAFDAQGNLFTGDNNSDGGDRARFVYLAQGGNSGWHIGFQWLDDRGPWNREKLWHTEFPGQAAYILPPIAHIASGPSGLTMDPGTGLLERYRDNFFLCDFRATTRSSGILALKFRPRGAGFELAKQEQILWHVVATDVEVGVDGALYISDWVEGWGQTGKGRIYRLGAEESETDPIVAETRELLASGMAGRGVAELFALLAHPDQRVRQEAQFSLVDAGEAGELALRDAALDLDRPRARLHGIWGTGILARKDVSKLEALLPLLADGEALIRAQTAKVINDAPLPAARKRLQTLTRDANASVRYHAAMALGAIGDSQSIPSLLAMLAVNADRDVFLRHAGAEALRRIADLDALRAASAHSSRSVRLAVLLAHRGLHSTELTRFLADPDPALVVEAARAIYDLPVYEAYPELATLALRAGLRDEALLYRVLNANRYLGTTEHGRNLIHFAMRKDAPQRMRLEALHILTEWSKPEGQDRVLGLWRPVPTRSHDELDPSMLAAIEGLLTEPSAQIQVAASEIAAAWELTATSSQLMTLCLNRSSAGTARAAALKALDSMKVEELAAILEQIDGDDPVPLRETAVRVLARIQPEQALPILDSLIASASKREKQNAINTLGEMDSPGVNALIGKWLERLLDGDTPANIQLDLLTAAAKRENSLLADQLLRFEAARPMDNPAAAYVECLEGGLASRGRKIFFEHQTAQCVRCHALGDSGGDTGPVLDGIGADQTREYLLQALVAPSNNIAPGFEMVVLTKNDDSLVAGILREESGNEIQIMDADNKLLIIPKTDLKERSQSPVSVMPSAGGLLTKHELRDLIEYLASLKKKSKKD